jgi:TRAP-type C4-dicarboxylate transport system substrate-binding protein
MKIPRHAGRVFRATLFLAAAAAFTVTFASAKQTRVKLATLAPKGTSFHIILQEMAEKWKAAPDGGVSLTMFTDGSMGGEGDMVKRMRLGQLQAGLLTASGIIEIEPEVAGFQNIPMAFRSLDEAAYVRDQLAPRFEKQIAAKGFIMLGWCDSGWWRIFSKNPIRTPDDLRNEKLNIGVGNPGMSQLVRALGMQPVELEPTNILVSLQTGLITMTPSPPVYALAGQFYQPAPYMLELNWAPLVGGIVLTKRAWDDLTPAQQEVVRKSGAEACAKITETARKEMVDSVEAMKKHGLHVQTLDGDLLKQWMTFFDDVQKQARGTMVPEATFDEILKLLHDYREKYGQPAS